MATYRGAPYEAGVGPADGTVVLFAACPPPEELGFEPATGHWRKELRLGDVQAVWQSRPVGVFRGDRCIVLDDLGDRLHIGYLGHDAYRAEELGYWQVDRGVFELVAARDEVTDIVEERTDYPGSAPAPRTAPQPAAPGAMNGLGGMNGLGAVTAPSRRILADGNVALPPPPPSGAPLPLEAEALRAASASASSRRDAFAGPAARDVRAGPGTTGSLASTIAPVSPVPPGGFVPAASSLPVTAPALHPAPVAPAPRRRRAARQRTATEQIFSELAGLAAIPASSYSVGEEVDGALCLLETPGGFEVFSCSGGARHEVRVFSDEESACFYLFGVLAAEAVRTGALAPGPAAAFAGEGLPRR
ncbi:MAG TPA: hypothetical protein VFX25_20850 [Streptosporangiaceae bacterium]|nr:hypothetical protein [Streptosporangiaceae bacterium]